MNRNTTILIVIVILLIIGALLYFGNPVSNPPPQNSSTSQLDSGNSQSNDSGDTTPLKEFTLSAKNFSFTPSTIRVQKGDRVKITLQNTGGMHDFVIDEFGVATKKIQDGQSDTIEFTADKSGVFEFYCSVGTHRAMGMKGSFIVE